MIDPRARPGWSTARRAGPSASLLSVLLAATGCDTAPLPDTADAPDSPAPEDSGEVSEGCGLARLEPVATEGGTLTAASARAYTGEPNDALGTQVHGIGDIDRDGCGDLIIQATPGVSGAAPEPVHYLVAGPPPASGVVSAVADAIWTDDEPHLHSEFGGNRTVPDVDLDGDHQMDVAFAPTICAGYCEVSRAEVFLLASGAAWPGTVQELPVLIRDDPSCENSSLLAGDWNGDGASDLAMFGGWNYGVSAWGAAWWGPFTAERQCQAPDARVPLPAGEDADLFFLTTPRAGDLDGDGRDELVIVGQRDREVDSLRRLFVIESVPSGDFDLDAPLLRLDDTCTGSTLLADLDGDGHLDLTVKRLVDLEDYQTEWLVLGAPLTRPDEVRLRIPAWWQSGAREGGDLLGGSGRTLLVSHLREGETAQTSFCALAPGASGEVALADCDLRFGPEVFSSISSFDVAPDVDGFGTTALLVGGYPEGSEDDRASVLLWPLAI